MHNYNQAVSSHFLYTKDTCADTGLHSCSFCYDPAQGLNMNNNFPLQPLLRNASNKVIEGASSKLFTSDVSREKKKKQNPPTTQQTTKSFPIKTKANKTISNLLSYKNMGERVQQKRPSHSYWICCSAQYIQWKLNYKQWLYNYFQKVLFTQDVSVTDSSHLPKTLQLRFSTQKLNYREPAGTLLLVAESRRGARWLSAGV